MPILFLIFLFIPIIEIYFLIQVGSAIGAGFTIFAVVFTALLGAYLVRAQGLSTLGKVQSQMAAGNVPAMEMMEGLFLLVAGALLLTPGFFTDAIGFVMLTPPLRRWMIKSALNRSIASGFYRTQCGMPGTTQVDDEHIIEAEYTVEEESEDDKPQV